MSRRKRPVSEYLEAAKRLAQFVPTLKKYKHRKTLKPAEKSAIRRREKQLRYADALIPLTKKQAKELSGLTFAPGVQAIQLRNTSPDASIKKIKKDMVVTSNGRTFLYWRLPIRGKKIKNKTDRQDAQINKAASKELKKAADVAFHDLTNAFPVEQVAELAQRAFKSVKNLKQIFLWAEAGRVGEGFHTFDEFVQWLYESFSQYRNVERWVNGIALQL